jgi:polyribonucleotide nucleotidyltransferase
VIPTKEIFPYTIRLVSEAFSSNGSTSMGSVCGSTIALMDGGVPIKAPVAGIASGLMMREVKSGIIGKIFGNKKYEYKILTDIQGPEDHHGDMDFKVAGTRQGITAIQMDVKVSGVPIPILNEAFEKAKLARMKILDVIEKEIAKPRPDISKHAPKIVLININKEKIGLVIGTGGKTIKEIKEKTGVDDMEGLRNQVTQKKWHFVAYDQSEPSRDPRFTMFCGRALRAPPFVMGCKAWWKKNKEQLLTIIKESMEAGPEYNLLWMLQTDLWGVEGEEEFNDVM